MKLLSIVSPIYNCEKTIARLLDSIVNQKIDTNLIQVVLCDDNSTDNWREIAETYVHLLPIVFCKTSSHKIHCPGNTRSDGMKYARGEWITFIDDDDMFSKDIFMNVIDYLRNDDLYYVSSDIDQFSSDMSKHGVIDNSNRFLIHGKFYRRSFLEDHGIDFKEDLYTMEDVYFNSLMFSYLYLLPDYKNHIKFIDKIGYKWIINPDSISHSYEQNHDDWFLDAHLSEYIYANTAPYLEMMEKWAIKLSQLPNPFEYTTPLFRTVVDVYFRYQSAVYQIGHELPDKNIPVISSYYDSLCKMFYLDSEKLIQTCIESPEVYFNEFRSNILSSGYFIPDESFHDFVRRMLS